MEILQFADDLVLYNIGKGDNAQREQMEMEVARIGKELNALGLDMEPKKTKILKFEERYQISEDPLEIKILGENVKEEWENKFLGIMFDKKMRFDTQIEEVVAKMEKANSLLK